MARAPSFIVTFLRQNPRTVQYPNTHLRNLTVDSKETNFITKEFSESQNQNKERSSDTINQPNLDIVKQVCKITRTIPRWEETLLSKFPSFNFSDPCFFRELLRQQENLLFSLCFFRWLQSEYKFLPNLDSCSVLFDKLVEAKACKAARNLLDQTGFCPEPASLERYLRCLCEDGLVEEAYDVFSMLKKIGYHPSIATWNLALLACVKVGRNDLVWKLYQDMIDSGVMVDIDVGTVECLIHAFCNEGEALKGYELLQQLLEDDLVPDTVAFHKLIAAFCKKKNLGRVSELLHAMIATNRAPDIYTYQEVINGLCKSRKWLEGCKIFNDLKDRGYAPDRVMYTTMIHGLCKVGRLGDSRKLWFEMINKGMLPNEYTYNALLYGLYKVHDLKEAEKLYEEMLDRGYGETTVSYNNMIAGFSSQGRMDEAYRLFEEMPQKGIVRDLITYNNLIKGFCMEGKIVESLNLLHELLAQGLQPSTSSYTPIIKNLCRVGRMQEAKNLLNDLQSRGLQPNSNTHDHIIAGLCEQGCAAEGMERLVEMLKNRLKPQQRTFEKLIRCLSQSDNVVAFARHHQKHPVNLVILGLFTVSLSLTVGVSCANTDGRIVLEALIVTAGVVASLTGYTFWASKRGKDFSYLEPILFTSIFILILTGLIQMFFPLSPTSVAIYGGISALIFCGYIVYDTDNLIKRFTYDDYILASAALYLDILNLFISVLRVLRSVDN